MMISMNQSKPITTDVLVYGATPGGIAAACTAADRGASVILLEPGNHVGGHLTSGICTTECEHMLPESFYGWMMKFLTLLGSYYGLDYPIHRWEPKYATRAYEELLAKAGVQLVTNDRILSVKKTHEQITSVLTQSTKTYKAKIWIDATYEGDLMAMAGVPYSVGRESIHTYGESLAGIRFIDSLDQVKNSKGHAERIDHLWEIDLDNGKGELIPGVIPSEGIHLNRGTGDGKVMNYHYRVIVTKNPSRIPFPKPKNYQEERFELLARFLNSNPDTPLTMILAFLNHPSGTYLPDPDGFTKVVPGEKWELNNLQGSILSLGYLGGQFDYPDGDQETRDRIIKDHYEQNAGFLYFLANSSQVPKKLQEEMNQWGLPPDEFIDNNHWPYQPYIRETRRMEGIYTLTQKDVLEEIHKPDAIYWNSHWIDSHHVQRLAIDKTHFRNEGRIWKEVTKPYAIPYRSLVPKPNHCTNLIVPGCVSSSHVAFSSVRLESTWMGLGEAAGEAAWLALEEQTSVQEISIKTLQQRLGLTGS